MSDLKLQLTNDMKDAMRAHDSAKLGTIRYLLSEIKNFEIDNGVQDDAGVLKIIAREVKKVKDALIDFEKAGRADLVTEENARVAVMQAYLPQQMSDDDLRAVVQSTAAESDKKDFGSVMKAVMAKVGGQADGGRVSAMVKEALAA